MICAGITLLTSCIRWGMTALQGAPLVFGMLCFCAEALVARRYRLAFAIAVAATTFKITLALPFLALLFLFRRHREWLAALAIWICLDALGFLRMGGAVALAAYRENVGRTEALDNLNTPDPWLAIGVPRLDWTYLFYGLGGNLQVARIGSYVVTALAGLWWLYEARRRARRPPDVTLVAIFSAPVICLSMLSVYHHHYDVALMIVPLLMSLPRYRELRPRWALPLLLPLIALMALLPTERSARFAVEHFGESARGIVHLMFPVSLTLTLIGTLIILHRYLGNQSEGTPTAETH
jgi:hypothetical protein